MTRSIDPSLVLWAPLADEPSLDLPIGPSMTFTRSGVSATYRDEAGLIKHVKADQPRFQGVKRKANYAELSNQFYDGKIGSNGYTFNRITAVQTDEVDIPSDIQPMDQKAWLVNDTATGSSQSTYFNDNCDMQQDGTYCISIYLKPKDGSGFFFQTNALGSANATTECDLRTGEVDKAAGHQTAGIIDVGEGWYRFYVGFKCDIGDFAGQVNFGLAKNLAVTYQLEGTNSLYMFGYQINDGLYPTEYVDTGAAASISYAYAPGDSNEPYRGFVVEESRTNIALQSEAFATTWATARASVSSNAVTSPDGSITADKLVLDATAANSHYLTQTVTVSTATPYTFSVFVKADELSWIALGTNAFTTPTNDVSYFDIGNGVLGTTSGFHDNAEIEDYGNGWYRCCITFTTDAADTVGDIRIFLAEADGDFTIDGDSTSGVYLWGAQMEAGISMSSYIPTAGTSQTRSADRAETTDVSWYREAGMSYYSRGRLLKSAEGLLGIVWDVNSGGSTANRITEYVDTTPRGAFFTAGGTMSAGLTTDTLPSPYNWENAGWFEDDNAALYDGGALEEADTAGNIPTGMAEFNIGQNGINLQTMNGVIQEIRLFNEIKNADYISASTDGTGFSALSVSPSVNQLKGMHLSSLPTSTDPRWQEIIAEAGITRSYNFIDDCHAALESLTGATGDLATLYKKYQRDYMMWDSETLRTAGGFDPNRDYDVAWDFQNRPTLTSLKGDNTLTYTRASIMTNVDENGFIYKIGVDMPPFWGHKHTTPLNDDATNCGLSSPGLSPSSGTTTTLQPDIPEELADKGEGNRMYSILFQEDGSNAPHYLTDGAETWQGGFRHSAYVKKPATNTAKRYIYLRCSGASVSTQVTWDLDDIGKGGIRDEDFTTNIGEWGQYDCGNGWWRIWVTGTASGNDMNGIIIGLSDDPSKDLRTYTGDSVQGFLAAGWMLEAIPQSNASLFPTVGAPTADDFKYQEAGDPFQTKYTAGSANGEGILLEPVETNLLPYSADLDNAAWNPTATVTAHNATGPDGQLSGHKIEDTDGAGYQYIQDAVAYTANTDVCISLFVRKDSTPASTRFALLRVVFSGGTQCTLDLYFDTSTGDTNPVVLAGPGSIVNSGVEDYGDYWRFFLVANDGDNANTAGTFWLYPAVGANADLQTISPTTTGSIIAWGAQYENNDSPTSYIPTAGAAATRATPYCSTTDISFYTDNGGAGTVYCESSVWNDRGGSKIIWQFDDNSTNNRNLVYTSGSYDAIFLGVSGALTQWNIIGTENAFANSNYASTIVSFDTNDIEGWAGGVQTGTDTSATLPVNPDRLWFGMRTGSADVFGGFISKWAYWPTLKPSSFMERASTDDSSVLK